MIIAALLSLFPWTVRRCVFNLLFGYKIHRNAYISRFVLIGAEKIEMASGSMLSAGCVVKGVSLLQMDEKSYIGTLNWISAFPIGTGSKHFIRDTQRHTVLHLKRQASISSRHIIDCTDSVVVGEFSTIAGYRSQVLTHSLNLQESQQRCLPVSIGKYCFLGTAVTVLPGSFLPDYSVLAAHSLLNKCEADQWMLYGGVPAKKIRSINRDDLYFRREVGFVE